MKAETCLNLCEIEEYSAIYPVISNVKEKIIFDRIYVGSYFCDELFLNTNYHHLKTLLDKISNSYKVTLVIPIFCQKNLKKGKELLIRLIETYHHMIDEITVNDYGILRWLSCFNSNHSEQPYTAYMKNIKINMGRLFFKDYRDPRYEKYFERNWKPKSFTEYLETSIQEYQINEIEIDVTHMLIDLSEVPDCIIGIHTPYTYMTTGKICEFASMFQPVQKKLRPNIDCSKECLKSVIEYEVDQERKWFRIGRTIYFENNCIKISNYDDSIKNDEQNMTEISVRLIYFPINELISYIKGENE
ncbi:MAG: hypothetical protein II919_03540 [Lachnospiraceae bacterium]|nr:hypothetical protein [Lachnospiraceae bacterium]